MSKRKSIIEVEKIFRSVRSSAESFSIDNNKGHLKVKMKIVNDVGDLVSFRFVTGTSPSDSHGMKNFRAHIRREFRNRNLESQLVFI